MMRIGLDLRNVTSLTKLKRGAFNEVAQAIVERAANEVYSEIHRQANHNLKSTRQIYKRNINRPEMGRARATITLTGMLPNMIERGAQPFDMKLGFSRSKKVKHKADGGWYLTIPFRYATAGSLGESEAFAGVMPPEVTRMARQLKATITLPFLGVVQKGRGMSASSLKATKHGVLGSRDEIPESAGGNLTSAQRAGGQHKSPQFAGLTRQKQWYQLVSQGSYVTFRRVSDKSAQNSWIHRGIKAYNLMEKAVENVDFNTVGADIIDSRLSSMGI